MNNPITPDPVAPTPEERNWAVGAHLSSLSGYIGIPFGHILGPLIVWLIKKDESPFVAECAKESLNYGISFIIAAIICGLLCLVLIGFLLLPVLLIFDIIVTISAAMAASNGQQYRYPMTIRFIS